MKLRVISRPNGGWVVQRRKWFVWLDVEWFHYEGAERKAIEYANALKNPTIWDIK